MEQKTEETKTWYLCPQCGSKLARVKKEFVGKGVFVKCKKCKGEIEIVRKENSIDIAEVT